MADQPPERSRKNWQVAFLLGFVLLILVAVAGFGLSSVTAGIGLGATILGILNALLAPPTVGGVGQNWFLSKAKGILNVGPYLKGLTLATWLATLGLGGHEVWATHRNSRLITIEGLVQTAGGDLADGAVVALKGLEKDWPPTIAKDGRFEFKDIDPQRLPSRRVVLEATWKNLDTHFDLDLNQLPSHLLLKLPPGELPLRITYRELDPEEIKFIIQGKVSPALERKLGNQPFIIPNRTFAFAKSIFKDLSYEYPEASREISLNEFYRAWQNLGIWNLAVTPYSLTIWKPAKWNEVERFFNPGIDYSFYQQLEGRTPDDFGILDITLHACSGWDKESDTQILGLELRRPVLRIALIENVSSTPVNLGDFLIKENNFDGFRRQREDLNILKEATTARRYWFAPKILRPGEEIVIPVSIRFRFRDGTTLDEDLNFREQLARKVQLSKSNQYPINFDELTLHIDRAKLLEVLGPSRPTIDPDEYILGSSVLIDGLTADGVLYPTKESSEGDVDKETGTQKAEGDYVMLDGDDVDALPETSCPFIYTYNTKRKTWLKEGPVLYGLWKKAKEALDEIPLRRFDGRILIREEEPETSFIDFMTVKMFLPSGEEKLFYPRNDLLRSHDKHYLQLDYGEEIEIPFEGAELSADATYVLIARGYYLPYKSRLPRN